MIEHLKTNLMPEPNKAEMPENSTIQIQRLRKLWADSLPLMRDVSNNHQQALDCCYALRFLMRMTPDSSSSPFLAGLDDVIVHMEGLRTLATSYHNAIGDL